MLKTKRVGAYTVSQMGTLEGCNFRVHQRKIEPQIQQDRENEGLAEWLNEWAFLAAVTTPYISQDDYRQMDIMQSRELLASAEELNSALSDAQEAPSKKKPKEKTQKPISE